jgi:hypothetical protein
MKKIVRLGTINNYSIFCKIQLSEDGCLSISGVEGPLANGDCKGSSGQINRHLKTEQSKINLAPGWTSTKLAQFFDIWEHWHLNYMKAGTPEQEAELKKHTFPGYPVSHHEWASKILKDAGLNPHNGYVYGSAWKKEEVPADVITFLESLPDTDKTPAWV